MTLDSDLHAADDAIVHALRHARETGQPVDAAATPVADAAQAYRVQAALAQALRWFGSAPARHWKSGGPRRDAVLTHAPLPPAGVWPSGTDARAWPWHLRGIEAEIAFRLGESVSPAMAAQATQADALAWADAMTVSIEIVDSRWQQGMDAPPWHKLADLQSHGALVLGEWQPVRAIDWLAQRCELRLGGTTQVFTGTHALQDPTWGLPHWLRHATRHGDAVAAGTVVTTGTWCGLPMAQAGDTVEVRFDGIGGVSVRV